MKKEAKQEQLDTILKRFWILEVSACTDRPGTQQNELWVIPKAVATTEAEKENLFTDIADSLRSDVLVQYDDGTYDTDICREDFDNYEDYEDALTEAENEYYEWSGDGWWTEIVDYDTLFDALMDTLNGTHYHVAVADDDRKIIDKFLIDAEDAVFDDEEEGE